MMEGNRGMNQGQEFDGGYESASAVLEKYGRDPHRLVTILQEIQTAYSYLPEPVMAFVAKELGVPPGTVYGVATFYAHFTMQPRGKYIIRICDGTACHVKKSEAIIKAVESELGLSGDKLTTDDIMFTLEPVACLGACGLAPVVVINEEVHGGMNKDKMIGLIEEIRKEESANA